MSPAIVQAADPPLSIDQRTSGIDLQYVDSASRPQDNFFRHVSGKWLDTADIPADRARYGAFDQLRDRAEEQLRAIVDDIARGEERTRGPETRKIADLYKSFMDEGRADALGLKPLEGELARIDAVASLRDLSPLLARLARLGVTVPIQPSVDQDARESTRYAVYLNQGGLGLPDRDYYLKEDDAKLKTVRDEYLKHVEKMLSLTGQDDANKAARAILDLETSLARLQWTKVENRNPVKTYNKTEVEKLADVTKDYDWRAYLVAGDIEGKVNYVIIRQPSFFSGLGQLLEDTPLAAWKSYLKWHLVEAYAPYLSKRFVDQDFAFFGASLRGIPANRPRWKRGVALVEQSIGEGMGRLYVARHFPADHKVRMQTLVQNLLAAYRQSIETLDWMGPATKREALAKLAKFSPKVGYPDKWRDYSALKIDKDDLIGNVMRARTFEYERQIAKLGKPIDRGEWGMTPQTVNAYYDPQMNEIVFPAAILQPPFFNPSADDAANYGGIGAVIGHEISHGFDDRGSQSDGDGNLRDWWTKEDHEKFALRTRALVTQYNAYSPLSGYNVNGELTLGENIADNSGLAIAYKAYQISLDGHPPAVLDGLTGDQRLFTGWAQVWRGKARDSETIRLIKIDPHAPAMFRCNGALVNQAAFYGAFGVKEGDKMFIPAEKRVGIW